MLRPERYRAPFVLDSFASAIMARGMGLRSAHSSNAGTLLRRLGPTCPLRTRNFLCPVPLPNNRLPYSSGLSRRQLTGRQAHRDQVGWTTVQTQLR